MHASRYISHTPVVLALLAVTAALSACGSGSPPQAAASQAAGTGGTTAGAVSTPTYVPVAGVPPPRFESVSPPAVPSDAPPPAPAPVPTDAPVVQPTAVPEPPQPTYVPPPVPQPTPATVVAGAQSVRLDDEAWFGGWKQGKTYGGRSATWIYGSGTPYNAMEAAFELSYQPASSALLSIEGMDGEHATKMQISILVNGITLWTGPNPLPDDNFDLATGTWDTFGWTIPAELLQPGVNTITIVALSEGSIGQPPFMMLDYADVYIDG